MEGAVVECELAERDPLRCQEGCSLAVLGDVQRAYEERMEQVDKMTGIRKLQTQVDVLRSWVSDLVGQNTLLAQAVEELEAEATSRIYTERRKHSEMVCELRSEVSALRRRLARKDSDMRGLVEVLRRLREFDYFTLDGIHFFEVTESDIFGNNTTWQTRNLEDGDFQHTKLNAKKRDKCACAMPCGKLTELKILNDSLHKENIAKDRELRKLNKDVQQYEQTILNLRNELSFSKYQTSDVLKKDAEVMAGMCCTASAECGDWRPVKEFSEVMQDDVVSYRERIHKMEENLKSSTVDVASLRTANVTLREEARALRGACAALAAEARAAAQRANFKDDIIRELRAQLKRAKAQVALTKPFHSVITSYALYLLESATSTDGLSCSTLGCQRTRKVDKAQTHDISYVDRCTSAPELSEPSVHHKSCLKRFRRPKRQICIQVPETACKAAEVQELFFNGRCGGFATSTPKKKCATASTSQESPRVQSSNSVPKCTVHTVLQFDDGKESLGGSEADSPSAGSCASARAQYYQNKLMATLQILQNKDETIRVQAESLTVAEARIKALTLRTAELNKDIDKKNREIQSLLETKKEVEKSDACVWAELQETDNQTNIMKTLQNNLNVIEDLYRECFYETAKQEGIIEMLRKSYLDVRLMEKDKSDQITKLNNVINTQKWSLDRCQDIASEVENLKIEITNFLNSSNNDSGVWEESADGVMEDLQDINAQLLSLRELLTGDCTCGLSEENKRLKHTHQIAEKKVSDLREKVSDLENILDNKDKADKQLEQHLALKEKELQSLRHRLLSLENETKECCRSCESSQKQLQQSNMLLNNKNAELSAAQSKCKQYEDALKMVKQELEKYQECDKEKCTLREEAKQLRREVRTLRAQLLHQQRHSATLQECCRQEARNVELLEGELALAATRGAALCSAARRAVHTVRGWAAQLRAAHREQETVIETKDTQLRLLRKQIEEMKRRGPCPAAHPAPCPAAHPAPCPAAHPPPCPAARPPPCPSPRPCPRQPPARPPTDSCNKCCSTVNPSRLIRISCLGEDEPCSRCVPERRSRSGGRTAGRASTSASASEAGSSARAPAPPAPPPRLLKKRHSCHELQEYVRDVSIQLPVRRDASATCTLETSDTDCVCRVTANDPIMQWSPCEELFSRVEGAGAALAEALSRWRKPPRSACPDACQGPATTSSE